MITSIARRGLGTAIILGVLAFVSACSSITTTTATTPGGTAPPSISPTPFVSATPIPSCASALPGAIPPSGPIAFADAPSPSGVVVKPLIISVSGDGLWQVALHQGCLTGTSVGAVQTLFDSGLLGSGWVHSPLLPFNGAYLNDCGDPYCWVKDKAPRYVGLEDVKDYGGGIVTFQLRIITPPPQPTCPQYPPSEPPAIPTTYTSFFSVGGVGTIPMPPLTQVIVVDGTSPDGHKNDLYLQLCSAGSATAVKAFYNNELSVHGWTYGTSPCGSPNVWYQGKVYFDFAGTVTDGKLYHMNAHNC